MRPFRLSIQAQPAALLGPGLEHSLDRLAAHGLDAIHANTHNYYCPAPATADADQPAPATWAPEFRAAPRYRGLGARAWVKHDPALYRDVGLFHIEPPVDDPTHGRDIYAELIDAAEARGIRVHGRYLDGWGNAREQLLPGWRDVLVRTLDGHSLPIPCFTNPRVQEWWRLTAGETARRYPKLQSLFYGIERGSTFNDVAMGHGQAPYCFCEHCVARARAHGIDVARAKEGYRALHTLASRTATGERPRDGAFVELFRLIFTYPEIAAWDRLERDGLEEMSRIGHRAVKAARPDCGFGQIAHQAAEPHRAAQENWGLIRGHADYAVLRIYAHIWGARVVDTIRKRGGGRTILGSLPEEVWYGLAWNSLHPENPPRPSMDELHSAGDPPHLQGEVLRRCREAVGPETPVYIGLGVDISYPFTERRETPPDYITASLASLKAQPGKLPGVLICRELSEVGSPSLRAIDAALG